MNKDPIDQFYADINAIAVESIFAFEAEVNASMVDPETAPDPEYADMAVQERHDALDDYYREEAEWQREIDWQHGH
jgi:uncharacterized protein YprB with RNaseH-like and TPR domain